MRPGSIRSTRNYGQDFTGTRSARSTRAAGRSSTRRSSTDRRSSDPDRVLATKSGRPWVDRRAQNAESMRTEFDKLEARLPFRHLKKTAATTLRDPRIPGLCPVFPRPRPGDGGGHALRPAQPGAVLWLREAFAPTISSPIRTTPACLAERLLRLVGPPRELEDASSRRA